jgi:hypothetical protein
MKRLFGIFGCEQKPSAPGTIKQTDFTCGVRPKENITRENIFHRKYPHEESIQ